MIYDSIPPSALSKPPAARPGGRLALGLVAGAEGTDELRDGPAGQGPTYTHIYIHVY